MKEKNTKPNLKGSGKDMDFKKPRKNYHSQKRYSIKVIPNSKVTGVFRVREPDKSESFLIRLRNPPIKGKANKELLKMLSDYFGTKVKIVSGKNTRKKIIEIY